MKGPGATRRALHVVLLLGWAGLVALLARSWVPAAVAVPLAGLLAVGFLETLLPLPTQAKRNVRSPMGRTLLHGDDAVVELETAVPLPGNLDARSELPEGLAAQDGRPDLRRTATGVLLEQPVRAVRRGESAIGPATLTRTGMLGTFSRAVELPLRTPVEVRPDLAVGRLRARVRPPTLPGLPARTRRHAPGDDFHALREYLPGDEMRDINWKATARFGRPIVNEHLPEEPPRTLLYLDTRATNAEHEGQDALERTLSLGAGLGEALMEHGGQVGLVLLAYWTRFEPPGRGKAHEQRLRRLLMDCAPGQPAALADIVRGGMPHVPGRTTALLVTPDMYDPTLQDALFMLQARHGRVLLLVPGFPASDGASAAAALLNTDQAAVLAGLRVERSAQWLPGQPVHLALVRLGLLRGSR